MSSHRFLFFTVVWIAALVTVSVRGAGQTPLASPPPGPVQPIPYSHRVHVGIGLDCRFCHANPELGKLMTYPPTETCMGCHKAVAADRPTIKTLASFAASGKPIPWVRVYQVPDYVFWSHGTHLAAEIKCEQCHGPVGQRDVVTRETDVTTMLGCRTCHDKLQVYTECNACHDPRSPALSPSHSASLLDAAAGVSLSNE